MKKNVLLIIVCFMSIIAMANTGDVVNLIRAKIEKVVLLLSQDERDAPEHVYEFGYDYRRKTGYEDMASAVSNDFIQVFSNFNHCYPIAKGCAIISDCFRANGADFFRDKI